MAKANARLEAARNSYREALEAARTNPSPEAWARLLAAGKDLSAAEEPRPNRSGRRTRRTGTPTYRDLEGPAPVTDPAETHDPEQADFEHVD